MQPQKGKLNPYCCSNQTRAADAVQFLQPGMSKTFLPGMSIVILNLDKPELICPLVQELVRAKESLASGNSSLELIIGDTGSTDHGVLACYAEYGKHLKLQQGLRYCFSKNNNTLFSELATRDLTLFLNNDIVFQQSAADLLEACIRHFGNNSRTGILGASLLYPDRLHIQHCGIDFFDTGPFRGLPYHPRHKEQIVGFEKLRGRIWQVPAVTGAFLCIRSEAFQKTGGFDEAYRTECQDVDLCLRARVLGWNVELLLTDSIVHVENATRPEQDAEDWADRARFVRQWGSFIEVQR